jgi:hypothetical protein
VAGDLYYINITTGIGNGTFRLVDLYNNVLISTNLNSDTDTFALPRTGTYVLVLEGRRDSGSGSSNYSLIVQPVAPSVVTPLTIGSTVNGTIAITGESDLFSFTLAQTTRVHFDSLTDSGSMTWTLTGPSGTLVNHRPFNSSDSFDFGAPLMSVGPGTYTLMVDANDDVIGNYGFRLLDAAAAIAITPGTPVNGSLSPATESDLYRFEGVAGDLYYINITTGIGNGTFRLVDLYNNVLISTNLNADTDTFALPRTGTYVLVLEGRRDSGSGSSNYSLIVQPVAPSVVTPLTIGSTVNGTIAITGESDLFSFTLAQTTRVHFDSLTDSGSMTWTLTGPSGTLVNHRPFNSSDSFDFGAPLMSLGPGAYTLMVDANDDVIGNYSFRLLDAAAAVAITPAFR